VFEFKIRNNENKNDFNKFFKICINFLQEEKQGELSSFNFRIIADKCGKHHFIIFYIFFTLIFYIKDLQSNLDKYSTYDQQDPFYFLSDLLDNCVSATLRSLFQFSVS
jgi:hypothetical protein